MIPPNINTSKTVFPTVVNLNPGNHEFGLSQDFHVDKNIHVDLSISGLVVLEENISKLPHPNFVSTLKFTQG
jgi:hypothetical protein